jgi:HEAT repeat protein
MPCYRLASFSTTLLLIGLLSALLPLQVVGAIPQESSRSLTPLQLEIEKQRNRLNSLESEERRDALTRLGALHHPEASRAGLAGLSDASAIVRATATGAILSLPGEESAAALQPLLNDKDEFVRQEAAYALGRTRSRATVAPLIELLGREKKDGVRGAIVVALGDLGDEAAVVTLAQVLRPELATTVLKKRKKTDNALVLRAAAHSLGQIRNRAAVPSLIAALQDEQAENDVRREAAIALGLIGDAAALPALNGLSSADDPYLLQAAFDASRRITIRNSNY